MAARTPDLYADLMRRRELIYEEWMRHVARWKAEGLTVRERTTPGVVLHEDGKLQMTGFDRRRRYVVELSIVPFSYEVVVTYPEKALS